jgi:hypothetical protein
MGGIIPLLAEIPVYMRFIEVSTIPKERIFFMRSFERIIPIVPTSIPEIEK